LNLLNIQKLLNKLAILNEARKTFRNWYLFPLVYFKIIKKQYVFLETRNGIIIKIRTNSTDLMTLTNVWLIKEYFQHGLKINNEDIIIDIGAHIGLFSLYVSQYCKKGKIFCFEPIKNNFELLEENIMLNKIKNVFPYNVAVSSSTSTATIFLSRDEAAHSMYLKNSNPVVVKSTSLEKIFYDNKIEKCDLLKLDCEGAEYDILEILSENLFHKINKIILEYHFADSKNNLISNLIKKLEKLSFNISIFQNVPSMGIIYATK